MKQKFPKISFKKRFQIWVRVLLLKIHYELSYFEQAYSLIDSTLHFLKDTSEFSDFHKIPYRAFVQYLKEILKLKFTEKSDPHSITFLEKKSKEKVHITPVKQSGFF